MNDFKKFKENLNKLTNLNSNILINKKLNSIKIPFKNTSKNLIIELQTMLFNKGYLGKDLNKAVDGIIGNNTKKAINKYLLELLVNAGYLDNSNNKEIDGIIGSKTRVALLKALKDGFDFINNKLTKIKSNELEAPFLYYKELNSNKYIPKTFENIITRQKHMELFKPKIKIPYKINLKETEKYDLAKLQADLFDNKLTNNNFTKFVTGTITPETKKAIKNAYNSGYTINEGELLKKTELNYTPSNSLYALFHRSLLDNIYPYDYSEITFDPKNVKYYNEFLDLDLNTPEGIQRANEIRKLTTLNGKPIFSNRHLQNNKTLQRQFRERYDLFRINSGKPLKYNSFNRFVDKNGKVFYEFSNLDINNAYASKALTSKNKFGLNENKAVIAHKQFNGLDYKYVPRDNTNVLFNQYSIHEKNSDGLKSTLVHDIWDFAPSSFLPGKDIAPLIKINRYDKFTIPSNSTEDFIIPNSVYDKVGGGSVRFNSNKIPRFKEYANPISLKYLKLQKIVK